MEWILFLFLEVEEVRHIEGESRTNDDFFIGFDLQLLFSYILFELRLNLFFMLVQRFITIFLIITE